MKKSQVHRGADRLRAAAGRGRHAGGRCVPADRRVGGDVLHVEEEVRRARRDRAAQAQMLEDENARLKRVVADLTLDSTSCRRCCEKKSEGGQPPRARAWIRERFGDSVQQACRLALLQRSMWYRQSRAQRPDAAAHAHSRLALSRPRFGYLRIHVLLRREGWLINRKRVHRLYRLDGLQVRMRVRRRKRIELLHRGPCLATAANQHWSMDFVHDQMHDGRHSGSSP